MRHIGLFEGIGGFSLAARWMGWETIAWCEWNEFCQKILSYHFPNAKQHGDITKTDFSIYRGQCDIVTGGFPCQPFSVSGEQKGGADVRYLYPEMLRAIREIKPEWIVAENVRGITSPKFSKIFEEISASLEIEGYETLPPLLLPATAVGADHERYRTWFIAHSNSKRYERQFDKIGNQSAKVEIPTKTLAAHTFSNGRKNKLPEPLVIGRTNGLPINLDGITFSKWREGSISGFGNAIVPQLALEIFKVIEQMNNSDNWVSVNTEKEK